MIASSCCIVCIHLERLSDKTGSYQLGVFMGRGFTSREQESGSVFSADVCIVQASKPCVESLPLVLEDRRSCFSQGEKVCSTAASVLALRK